MMVAIIWWVILAVWLTMIDDCYILMVTKIVVKLMVRMVVMRVRENNSQT